jgi:hypothetical protein
MPPWSAHRAKRAACADFNLWDNGVSRGEDYQFVPWDQTFFDPIELPKGKKLVTLRDAATYITKLPKAEHDAAEWQAAMEALLLVAESGGPTMFARIGVMRALNAGKLAPHHVPRSEA